MAVAGRACAKAIANRGTITRLLAVRGRSGDAPGTPQGGGEHHSFTIPDDLAFDLQAPDGRVCNLTASNGSDGVDDVAAPVPPS